MEELKWGFELHSRNCRDSCTSLWQARLLPTVPRLWLLIVGVHYVRERKQKIDIRQKFSLQFYILYIQLYKMWRAIH